MPVMTPEHEERLAQTMRYIEEHPETWRQSDWGREFECGTAYCLFGHGVNQAGGQFLKNEPHPYSPKFNYNWVALDSLPSGLLFPWDERLDTDNAKIDGGRLYIETFLAGAMLFGLERTDADDLSNADNDMEALCRLIAEVTGKPWASPWHGASVPKEWVHVQHGEHCTSHTCALSWHFHDIQDVYEERIEAPDTGEWEVRLITRPGGERDLEWRRPEPAEPSA